jgi:hypothetical protein
MWEKASKNNVYIVVILAKAFDCNSASKIYSERNVSEHVKERN